MEGDSVWVPLTTHGPGCTSDSRLPRRPPSLPGPGEGTLSVEPFHWNLFSGKERPEVPEWTVSSRHRGRVGGPKGDLPDPVTPTVAPCICRRCVDVSTRGALRVFCPASRSQTGLWNCCEGSRSPFDGPPPSTGP